MKFVAVERARMKFVEGGSWGGLVHSDPPAGTQTSPTRLHTDSARPNLPHAIAPTEALTQRLHGAVSGMPLAMGAPTVEDRREGPPGE